MMKYDYEFIEDLIPLILDADEHWWQCHLAALARVSRGWLYNVRKRLYACPDIRTFGGVQKLADTVEANEYLGSLVVGLSLEPVMSSNSGVGRGTGKGLRILLGLEGLKKIRIGGDINGDRYIRYIGRPELVEELHLKGSRGDISARVVRWDEMLTFGFPRLKKMRLSSVDVEVSGARIPYAASFTELILEDVQMVNGRVGQLVNGAKWLRCLHVSVGRGGALDEEQLREVLGTCAVECVHYEVGKSSGGWNALSGLDVESGGRVRCLHLEGHLMDVGILETLRVVFRNVEELVVGGRLVSVTAGEWARFVGSGGLGSVRRLGLPWGTNGPPYERWTSGEMGGIRAACVKQQIRMIERGKVL